MPGQQSHLQQHCALNMHGKKRAQKAKSMLEGVMMRAFVNKAFPKGSDDGMSCLVDDDSTFRLVWHGCLLVWGSMCWLGGLVIRGSMIEDGRPQVVPLCQQSAQVHLLLVCSLVSSVHAKVKGHTKQARKQSSATFEPLNPR